MRAVLIGIDGPADSRWRCLSSSGGSDEMDGGNSNEVDEARNVSAEASSVVDHFSELGR